MKFCSRCGTELKDGQTICPQCGHNLVDIKNNKEDNDKSIDTNIGDDIENINMDNIKKNIALPKKVKVSIMGIVIIVILIIIFFKVGNYITKPSNIIMNFQKAIMSNNKEELSKILYSQDSRLKVNEKSIEPLMLYINGEPSYLNNVIENLNKQAMEIESFDKFNNFNQKGSQNILNIVCVGKKFYFFPNYKISIKPAFIEINTSVKNVGFLLNGINLGKSDRDNFSKEFGPFMPGKYKLLSNYKGEYISLNESYDINFITAENVKEKIDAFKNLNYVSIGSEYQDAEVFVNGKNTGVKIKDAQNFGPLSENSKVYAIIKKDGKALKSNEYTILEGDTDIYLSFEEAENQIENTENQFKDVMYEYLNNFTQAVNTQDFSMIEYYLYPGSKFYAEQQEYVQNTYDRGIRETIMSMEVLSCNVSEDNNSCTITTKEVYNIDNNGEILIKPFKYRYKLRYNEITGSYQIEDISENLISN